MGREIQEHTVNGFIYKIRQLGSKEGKKALARLIRTAGPALDDTKETIPELIKGLTDENLDYFCDTFAKQTMYYAVSAPDAEFSLAQTFDEHFAGRYGSMTLWLKAALETNYGDFLGELGLDLGDWKAVLAAAMSNSPPAPIGKSGASSVRAGVDSEK